MKQFNTFYYTVPLALICLQSSEESLACFCLLQLHLSNIFSCVLVTELLQRNLFHPALEQIVEGPPALSSWSAECSRASIQTAGDGSVCLVCLEQGTWGPSRPGAASPCPYGLSLPASLCQLRPGLLIKSSISIVVVSGLSCDVARHRGGLPGRRPDWCVSAEASPARWAWASFPNTLPMSSKSSMRKRGLLTHIPESCTSACKCSHTHSAPKASNNLSCNNPEALFIWLPPRFHFKVLAYFIDFSKCKCVYLKSDP